MIGLLRDKWETACLRAKYQRLVQQQVMSLVEGGAGEPVAEDPGRWQAVGGSKQVFDEQTRQDVRAQARQLAGENPHAKNLLRLLEIYVVGPGLSLGHSTRHGAEESETLVGEADVLWEEFLEENQRHFSYREFARRTWRDGECFLRTYEMHAWPPVVRFVDPESIGATREAPESAGVVTDPDDVETPIAYLRIDPVSGDLVEEIPAEEMQHTRIGVDSNQTRGVTIFAPLVETLTRFTDWQETELLARKLQASIVLWRKVQGSPGQAAAFADAAQSATGAGDVRRERYRAGTILTTSQGTDLQFLQPNTNFGDAVPLGRLMLLSLAAGAGLPEFMLTSDASNANFSSTMVAEGPAVKLFQSEQQFFVAQFNQLWRRVMHSAIGRGLLPEDFFARVGPEWALPQLVNRDRPRERLADARLVESRILSRAEVARRDGVDPDTMQGEIAGEGVNR
ncbi:MAG: hypothetical protein CMJ48_10915 [Planctomycetaceae bacterium]|nr:hypothetical protein [Planctomycetaceae bacterium]